MRPVSVTVTGVGNSAWVPVDPLTVGTNDGLFVEPGAGATVAVEFTPDNVMDASVTPVAYTQTAWSSLSSKTCGPLPMACKAVRLAQSVGASQSRLTVVPRGIT